MRTLVPTRWLALAMMLWASSTTLAQGQCPDPATPVALALIDMERANRVSGAAMSQVHDGMFWLVNEGSDPRVHGFDMEGRWRVSLVPDPLREVEITDIAVRNGYVYLLDDRNDSLKVLRLREPTSLPEGEPVVSPAWGEDAPTPPELTVAIEVMSIPRSSLSNSAAMFVNDAGEIFIVSDGEHAEVYAVGRFGHPVVPREIARLDIPHVTAADLSADGHAIVVRSASQAALFRSAETTDIATLLGTGCPASLGPERRGSAVMFSRDNTTYYTLALGRTALFEYRIP